MKLSSNNVAKQLIIDGDILDEQSTQYTIAKKIWNSDIAYMPALIIRPKHESDLSKVITFAAENNYSLSVKNGGHGAAGKALNHQGIVIDMHYFKKYELNIKSNSIRMQGGLLNKDANSILYREAKNLSFPIGTCPFVGISGLTLGGGIGFLSKRHGLTCDNVIDFTLLTGNNQLLTVSEQENSDLFKALKGGGHCNYGIVTDINYQLHPIPSEVIGGTIAFTTQFGRDVLTKYAELLKLDDDDLFIYCSINNDINDNLTIQIYGLYLGDPDKGLRIFADIAKWAPTVYNDIKLLPYHVMQGSYEEHVPEYPHLKWKSGFVKQNPPLEFFELLLALYQTRPNQHCRSHIDPLGGHIARLPIESSSFINRQSPFLLSILAIWYDSSERHSCIEWARKFHQAVLPYFAANGHANYDDGDLNDNGETYFGKTLNHLQQLKSIHDPLNLFSGNISGRIL